MKLLFPDLKTNNVFIGMVKTEPERYTAYGKISDCENHIFISAEAVVTRVFILDLLLRCFFVMVCVGSTITRLMWFMQMDLTKWRSY